MREVDRDKENCPPRLGDRGLTRHDRLSQRLVRRQDHLAKYAAAPIDVLEIHFLNEIESKLTSHHLACDENDRRAIAVCLIQPVDEMQAARSATAGHGGQAVQ